VDAALAGSRQDGAVRRQQVKTGVRCEKNVALQALGKALPVPFVLADHLRMHLNDALGEVAGLAVDQVVVEVAHGPDHQQAQDDGCHQT
jgi:hypothetical protein